LLALSTLPRNSLCAVSVCLYVYHVTINRCGWLVGCLVVSPCVCLCLLLSQRVCMCAHRALSQSSLSSLSLPLYLLRHPRFLSLSGSLIRKNSNCLETIRRARREENFEQINLLRERRVLSNSPTMFPTFSPIQQEVDYYLSLDTTVVVAEFEYEFAMVRGFCVGSGTYTCT
jgi:hypothetical protein